ncbi:MAG: excinuclease ABC subunit UvrB [Patescibacteria group bacterium]|nr:excinuclease ABC subunit UvrB [Patescibacteria group bacterium]
MKKFELKSAYKPAGDQPSAIEDLSNNIMSGKKHQTLLGVTGSGKTFTIANVIEKVQKPTLVIAHNKTLAAQLASEFRQFFPSNAVEYFVSYYDYYQPEAYLPSADVFIEKDLKINDEIDRLRHSATASLLSRKDVIVVASVSCIYGLGSPQFYADRMIELRKRDKIDRSKFISDLVRLQYGRSEVLERGKFRVQGETFEVMRPDKDVIIRVESSRGLIERIFEYEYLSGEIVEDNLAQTFIFPAKHFIAPEQIVRESLKKIKTEMKERVKFFEKEKKIVEAERIRRRTKFDLELIEEIGYCSGIENYSLYLSGRKPGEAPYTLMDYFPKNFLCVIDESHVTVPQIGAMFGGDYSRKENLVNYGFRLPSAFDNRPLKFEEFENKAKQTIFVSATPAKDEIEKSKNTTVQQIVRPTGLVDPQIVIKPCLKQVKDVIEQSKKIIVRGERVLITTLTKKMAEDLAQYLEEADGLKSEYLHSEVDTLDRIRIVEDLRREKIDILVGVNLLREGLDLPEVSLVAILDADKEGFLRSETSLIQTIGRAARNVRGKVILYADRVTGSMKRAIDETQRRRVLQQQYNKKHGITPQTIQKKIKSIVDFELNSSSEIKDPVVKLESPSKIKKFITLREQEMKKAAKQLEFEKAAIIRDEISRLKRATLKK